MSEKLTSLEDIQTCLLMGIPLYAAVDGSVERISQFKLKPLSNGRANHKGVLTDDGSTIMVAVNGDTIQYLTDTTGIFDEQQHALDFSLNKYRMKIRNFGAY